MLQLIPLRPHVLAGFAACAASSSLGCAPEKQPNVPEEAPAEKIPPLHQLFPLKDRTVASFEMETDLGDKGVLVLEISRPRPELAELKIAGRVQRLTVEENRISQTTGGILLEEPIEAGHSFRGPFGTVTITEVGQQVTVPAGTYAGCIVTVEEAADPPKRATSTYCPGIGLVGMQVESFGEGAGLITTRLSYYGPRFEMNGSTEPTNPATPEQSKLPQTQ